MNLKQVTITLLLFFLVTPLTLRAQDVQRLQQEVEKLRRELRDIHRRQTALEIRNRQLEQSNARLEERVEETELSAAGDLETRINSLIGDSGLVDGTTVESVANPIKISGESRVRAGWTDGRSFGSAGDDDGTFVDARFNLAFDFTFSEDVTTHFELIANGLFDNGSTDHNTGNLDEVDLYQGWILFSNIFDRKEIGARIGRQEIVLGNEFQFGNNDFFGGETFDSTLIWWNDDNFRLIFVWAKLGTTNSFNASNHPYNTAGTAFDDDEAYVLYFTLKSIKNHELDLYYAYWNGHMGTTTGTLGNFVGAGFRIYAHLFGARLGGLFPDVAEGLDYNLEVAYETGNLSGTSIDVEGFTAEATVGLTFNDDNLFRLYAMFLFAEGFDGNDSGYVPLFPERHSQINWDDHTARIARWGLTDIMPMINVLAVQAGFTFRPRNDWILGLTGIYAWHDENVTTIDGTSADNIGFEVDLFAEHKLSDQATIGFGLGLFFPDDGAPLGNGSIGDAFVGNDDDLAVLFYLQTRVVF
ncbi:MAG TPA: hypothetical protein ENK43_13285 [Planctomycetes bacterium]|nr:hypothetical protein [Planctomycetota bacterium]